MNGKKHGFGCQTWIAIDYKYAGHWHNGVAQGYGKCWYPNGDSYQGEWFENKTHGHGCYHSVEEGTMYEGDWYEDNQHGFGIEIFGDGSKYEG